LKALIAYGTRYGATAGTSEEIGKILRGKGFDVKIVNLKTEKIKDISGYDLIVVASGMRMGKWVSEPEDFLKRFRKEFEHKKLAIFCSSVAAIAEKEGNIEEVAKIRKTALDDKVSKYGLKPVMTALFGGILNYNKMGWMRRGMEMAFKPRLQNTGFKETEPGIYDLRDWDEIRNWATELAEKASQTVL
jgi:menaquinone-dependent protoporphyrinogen oxidase